MTIGARLQQAREQRGLTLAAISERTKIRVPILRAIERDDFQQLPGGVISRGFLKLYAREVGLDPNEIGRRFTAEFEANEPADAENGGAADSGRAGRRADAGQGFGLPRAAATALVLLALLAIGYVALRPSSGAASDAGAGLDAEAGASGEAVETSSPSTASDPPSASATTLPVTTDSSPDVLRVDLHATAPCWISATVDGQQVAYRLMNAGERLALRPTTEAVLRIGIPANLTVSINDQPVPPAARPGTPMTLRITPANYRDLLNR